MISLSSVYVNSAQQVSYKGGEEERRHPQNENYNRGRETNQNYRREDQRVQNRNPYNQGTNVYVAPQQNQAPTPSTVYYPPGVDPEDQYQPE